MVIQTRMWVDPARAAGESHVLPWEVSRVVRANRTTGVATRREGTREVSRGRSRSVSSDHSLEALARKGRNGGTRRSGNG